MPRKIVTPLQEEVIRSIRDLINSPETYDTFIEGWQSLIASETNAKGVVSQKLHDVEAAAQFAIAAIAEAEERFLDSQKQIVPIETILEPAFIVDANGKIENLNDIAWQQFKLEQSKSIAQIDLEFADPDALLKTIANKALANSPDAGLSLLLARNPEDDTQATVLLIRVADQTGGTPRVLVAVNTGQSAAQSAKLLKDSFGLTDNEHAVLELFLEGRKLPDIAKLRSRSHQTVRNQMQSVFEKCGCHGQSDLMRLAFSLSSVLATVLPVVDEVKRNLRRPISFLRPDGRMVDAVLAGARHGRLVISLPSIFGHPLTSEIEEKLAAADIRMICIARPGMGKSDPLTDSESEADTLAEDIAAILSQLEEQTCILLGRASSAALVFALCNTMPQKISKAMIVNAVVPAPFLEAEEIPLSWTRSLVAAARNSSSVARLILRSGRRLMRVIGPRAFLRRMYSIASSDLMALDRADVVESIEVGVQMVTAQGFDAGSRDMVQALNDWSEHVAQSPMQVTLLQGTDDPNVPLCASRRFAEHFPEACKLQVIEGGGLLNFSHIDTIIAELNRHEPSLRPCPDDQNS